MGDVGLFNAWASTWGETDLDGVPIDADEPWQLLLHVLEVYEGANDRLVQRYYAIMDWLAETNRVFTFEVTTHGHMGSRVTGYRLSLDEAVAVECALLFDQICVVGMPGEQSEPI